MDILFVGYSSIVRRKVLPAAIKSDRVENISLATRKASEKLDIPLSEVSKIYLDYDKGIANSGDSLVYISLPNALHALWVEKALLAGHHVIVDKPAFLSYEDAIRLVDLANKYDLLLAEANVWTYHSLVREIQKTLEKKSPHLVYANFSSPSLPQDNFRYNPDMGAGILFDRGSYAVSCVRELFQTPPTKIFCTQRFSEPSKRVDIDLSIMMEFGDQGAFLGFFSLDCEYTNSLEIIGQGFRIDSERVFSPPPEQQLKLGIQQNNVASTKTVQACDTFQLFIEDVVNSVNDSSYRKFNELLLTDAELFERLLSASQH